MTWSPVVAAPVLILLAAVVIALRAVAAVPASRAGWAGLGRWGALTAALLLILVAAGRPAVPMAPDPAVPADRTENLFLVVDLSADAGRADAAGAPRLAVMRDDIEALLAAHPGARVSLLTFAARPTLVWPLSDDTFSLRPTVDALRPDPAVPAAQVDTGAAATALRYALITARQQYPGAANLVYYLGSGAAGAQVPQTEFDVGRLDGGGVFGYGDGASDQALRSVAEQLGVDFVRRGPGEALPPDRLAGGDRDAAADATRTVPLYWLAALLAAVLLLVEIGLGVRELRALAAGTRVRRAAP
jgi:hypothetical protein